jgi:hypothetical protein
MTKAQGVFLDLFIPYFGYELVEDGVFGSEVYDHNGRLWCSQK